MPAVKANVPPKYSLHKASGRACVYYKSRAHYLGTHGTPESMEAYQRFLIRWQAERAGLATPPEPEPARPFTVLELCWAYFQHAEGYYRKHGQPTRSLYNQKLALRAIKDAFGHMAVAAFRPRHLYELQTAMATKPPASKKTPPKYHLHERSGRAYVRCRGRVRWLGEHGTPESQAEYSRFLAEWEADLAARVLPDRRVTRDYVNKQIGAIKRMFKWGTARDLVPPDVYPPLACVEGLKKDRSPARESRKVPPVEEWIVDATLPYLPPIVADMVRFQRLTGARPGEVCILRPCDLDRSGEVWRYYPSRHKTEHRDRSRIIYVGPQAQEILRRYLLPAAGAYCLLDAAAFCFQPAESERRRQEERRDQRELSGAPVKPWEHATRPAGRRRPPRTAYDPNTYAQAVKRAVKRANAARQQQAEQAGQPGAVMVPRWHPNQLRHSAATQVRQQFGLEAAQVVMGHAKADVTQVYAERNAALAVEVVKRIG